MREKYCAIKTCSGKIGSKDIVYITFNFEKLEFCSVECKERMVLADKLSNNR